MKYALNKNEKEMLELYIQHFSDGNIDTHIDSQKVWIHDKTPIVETNIGWIIVLF